MSNRLKPCESSRVLESVLFLNFESNFKILNCFTWSATSEYTVYTHFFDRKNRLNIAQVCHNSEQAGAEIFLSQSSCNTCNNKNFKRMTLPWQKCDLLPHCCCISFLISAETPLCPSFCFWPFWCDADC